MLQRTSLTPMAHVHTASEFQIKLKPWIIVLAPVGVSTLVMTVATAALLGASPAPVDRASTDRLQLFGSSSSGVGTGAQLEDAGLEESESGSIAADIPVAAPEPRPHRRRGFSPVADDAQVPAPANPAVAPSEAASTAVPTPVDDSEEEPEFDEDGDEVVQHSPEVRAAAKARIREQMRSGQGLIGRMAAARQKRRESETVAAARNIGAGGAAGGN